MTLVAALPTRSDEAWRYSDHAALGAVWPVETETLTVEAGDTLSRVIMIDGDKVRVDHLAITLEAGAQAELFLLITGAHYGRIGVEATLASGAHLELGGAIIGAGDSTQEIVTRITHAEPNATSNQVIRSVLGGKATGSALSKVVVERGAQKTDAEQSVKAMLIDRTATANAKPELEIYADDVKCAHGCAIGELDAMGLFYLASRGLEPARAKALMLRAFIADSFANMAEGEAKDTLESRAQTALEAML